MKSLAWILFLLAFLPTTPFSLPPVSRNRVPSSTSVFSPSRSNFLSLHATAEVQHANPAQVKRVTTIEAFREELVLSRAENKLLVVKFFAPWCKSCAKINLPFEKMSQVSASSYFNLADISIWRLSNRESGIADSSSFSTNPLTLRTPLSHPP